MDSSMHIMKERKGNKKKQLIMYEKIITPLYMEKPDKIKFAKQLYKATEKEDTLPLDELENLDIVDISRYSL